MTDKQAQNRMDELHEQKVRCMVLDFRGQKPIDYLKIEVFEDEITEDSFHWQEQSVLEQGNWIKKKSIVDWKKNFIFLLGGLCGIESEPFDSEKQGKYSFVSKAHLYRVLPSGAKERASKSYEYDAEIRAEESILKNEIKFMEYQAKCESGNKPRYEVKQRYESEAKKQLAVVENAKFGRQKADSGAHKRAIIAMLKLPSPDQALIGVKVFCYKCSPDFSSQDVRQKYLSGGDPSSTIFGTPRIENKVETVKPESDDITVPEVEINIEAARENFKDQKAMYKLSGKILESKKNMEEFLVYMNGYSEMSQEDQVSTLLGWIARVEEVPQLNTLGEKRTFLVKWGK